MQMNLTNSTIFIKKMSVFIVDKSIWQTYVVRGIKNIIEVEFQSSGNNKLAKLSTDFEKVINNNNPPT